MYKFWLVARHEYLHHVRRRGFLLATFGVPLLLTGAFALLIWLLVGAQRVAAAGYVDHAGLLAARPARVWVSADATIGTTAPSRNPDQAVRFDRYADETAARQALDGGQIALYFVLPPDYAATGAVTGYAPTQVSAMAEDRFTTLLRQALLDGVPGHDPRLAAPIHTLVDRTVDGRRNNPGAAVLLPLLYGILFYIVNLSAGTYLLMSLVEEKENRVIEMLATSLRPGTLMAGKIVGLGLLGLTQLLVWVGTAALVLALGSGAVPLLSGMAVPWESLGLMIALFIPSYLLYAGTLCALGAAMPAKKEAGQLNNLVGLPAALPIWFFLALLQDPDGPLAIGFSLFPYTAPVAVLIRLGASPVPAWQLFLTLSIQVGAAAGMIWVAGRMLRYGLLRYGRRVGWRELGAALRGA